MDSCGSCLLVMTSGCVAANPASGARLQASAWSGAALGGGDLLGSARLQATEAATSAWSGATSCGGGDQVALRSYGRRRPVGFGVTTGSCNQQNQRDYGRRFDLHMLAATSLNIAASKSICAMDLGIHGSRVGVHVWG